MSTKIPDLLGQALQFRVANDQPIGQFTGPNMYLQRKLISEEYNEFLDAHTKCALYPSTPRYREDLLKEGADLVYVCFQYAVTAGFELDEALDRVHNSNMSKLVDGKPVKDETGKVMKGPNYKPPYLEDIV